MATAYRSSQSVTNGSAGTSVTVSKPTGIVDTGTNPARDQLIALIATVGAPTITAPAGWTLITSVASGTSVTLAAYRKLASSEGANWTWTLGASQRNWGWVGAYTGVDPTNPVTATGTDNTLDTSTVLQPSSAVIDSFGQGIGAAAAVRAATGAATTWTTTSTERSDLSTNAGAGTDIAGVIGDTAYSGALNSFYGPVLTASQAQTAGVAIALTLLPYFIPYDGGHLTLSLESALGVDPDSDLSVATWTAVSGYVLQDPGITIQAGRPNGTSTADPTRIAFTLKNLNGEWTNPTGAYARYLVRNLPFRVKVSGIGVDPNGEHRGTAFLASAKPRWDKSLNYSVVDVVAQGRLRRMQQNNQPLHSAAYRTMLGSPTATVQAVAYWSLEDQSGATAGASAFSGHPAAVATDIGFAGSSGLYLGSAPIAVLSSNTSSLTAVIPTYTTSDTWTVAFAMSLPVEPAAQTTLIQVQTTGTASLWRLSITPGTSALVLDVFDSSGTSLLSTNIAIDEASYYAQPAVHALSVAKSGSDINYEASVDNVGLSGTLAGRTAGQLTAWTTVASDGLANAALGHVGVFIDPLADASYLTVALQDAIARGHSGEWPWARFQRLCIENGVPYNMDQSENTDLTMGPQLVDSLFNLLGQCRDIEGCLMHDAGTDPVGATGVLMFPASDERDNATTALTLDFDLHQVTDGFEPTLDDTNIVNAVEASRIGGSSRTVIDQDSIDVEGEYKSQFSFNAETDQFLADLAGWRVNLGTLRGMRYPQIGWNLRRSPELVQQWLACAPSSKLDVANPPSQYPPDLIESFIEGYLETLSDWNWTVVANLSPAAGNHVRILANDVGDTDPDLGRDDWDSCVLAGSPSAGATSTTVTTTPLITTAADDFPFDVFIFGEQITITNCTGSSNPQTITMTRAVNGVSMAHAAGDAVILAAPLILTM
jgi:hypothetical protein